MYERAQRASHSAAGNSGLAALLPEEQSQTERKTSQTLKDRQLRGENQDEIEIPWLTVQPILKSMWIKPAHEFITVMPHASHRWWKFDMACHVSGKTNRSDYRSETRPPSRKRISGASFLPMTQRVVGLSRGGIVVPHGWRSSSGLF